MAGTYFRIHVVNELRLVNGRKSGRGLPHSKTLGIPCARLPRGASWSAPVLWRFRRKRIDSGSADPRQIKTKPWVLLFAPVFRFRTARLARNGKCRRSEGTGTF